VPVLLGTESEEALPQILHNWNRYRLTTFRANDATSGYGALLRLLNESSRIARVPVGPVPALPDGCNGYMAEPAAGEAVATPGEIPTPDVPGRKTDFRQIIDSLPNKLDEIREQGREILTAIKRDSVPVNLDGAHFRETLKRISEVLLKEIVALDRQTAWQEGYYVELEARVEVRKSVGSAKIRPVRKLLLQSAPGSMFLVIGEPGAGKSVALREVTRHALKEAPKLGKLPLYFNLRLWNGTQSWTPQDPPNIDLLVGDLWKRLEEDLRHQIGDVEDSFFTQYFQWMKQAGLFVFIFDSFDEIPLLLDQDKDNILLDLFSKALGRMLQGQAAHRGILACRSSRQPSLDLHESHRAFLLPLDEKRAAELIVSRLADSLPSIENVPRWWDNILRHRDAWKQLRTAPQLITYSTIPLNSPFYGNSRAASRKWPEALCSSRAPNCLRRLVEKATFGSAQRS